MKIAQVVTYISQDGAFGGPVAVALAQSIELSRLGHDVHLYAAWDGLADVTAPGVHLHLYRTRRPRGRLTSIFSPRLALALGQRRSQFDVVHIHFGRDLVSLAAWFVTQTRRRLLVVQTHGMVNPDNRHTARFIDLIATRRALRQAHAALHLTDTERAALIKVSGGQVRLIPIRNGVDVQANAVGRQPELPRVLFLARLHPRKQVLAFAQAALIVKDAGTSVRFDVIGPDEGDLDSLTEFIRVNDLQASLRYCGSLPPGRASEELSHSTIYILPSLAEVYPMTVLEALAVGTPVVLSRQCGIAEELEAARAAVIVDPSPVAIAQATLSLLEQEKERCDLGRRGHDYAMDNYSIGAVARNLETIYFGARI